MLVFTRRNQRQSMICLTYRTRTKSPMLALWIGSTIEFCMTTFLFLTISPSQKTGRRSSCNAVCISPKQFILDRISTSGPNTMSCSSLTGSRVKKNCKRRTKEPLPTESKNDKQESMQRFANSSALFVLMPFNSLGDFPFPTTPVSVNRACDRRLRLPELGKRRHNNGALGER